jgi:broad specificity phosphatase PhoE
VWVRISPPDRLTRKDVSSEMAIVKQKVFLIRHGETEFNRLGVFRGRFEVDLNERGRKQAGEIGKALRGEGIGFLLASPLGRAVETARIVATELGIECRTDAAFNNIALGDWQGVGKKSIERDFPEMWKTWTTEPENLRIPGGETLEEVRARSYKRLLEIVGEVDESFGIVTHRSVIKTLAASILGVAAPYFWKFYIDNAAYSVFEYSGSDFTLLSWNNNSHLTDRVTEFF